MSAIPPPPDPVEAAAWRRDVDALEADPRTSGKAGRPRRLVDRVLAERAKLATFEEASAAMEEQIRASHRRRIAEIMLPNRAIDRERHEANAREKRPSCDCRVCYWAGKVLL